MQERKTKGRRNGLSRQGSDGRRVIVERTWRRVGEYEEIEGEVCRRCFRAQTANIRCLKPSHDDPGTCLCSSDEFRFREPKWVSGHNRTTNETKSHVLSRRDQAYNRA